MSDIPGCSDLTTKESTLRFYEDRIRELEAERDVEKAAATLYRNAAKLKQQRIVKTREILEDAIHAENETHLASIASALEALEGK